MFHSHETVLPYRLLLFTNAKHFLLHQLRSSQPSTRTVWSVVPIIALIGSHATDTTNVPSFAHHAKPMANPSRAGATTRSDLPVKLSWQLHINSRISIVIRRLSSLESSKFLPRAEPHGLEMQHLSLNASAILAITDEILSPKP